MIEARPQLAAAVFAFCAGAVLFYFLQNVKVCLSSRVIYKPMLSILIPTYNYVCVPLVRALSEQAQRIEGLCCEIIVADDGSTSPAVLEQNRVINALPYARYWELGANVGRSAVRNRLFEQSKGAYLLFLDCDGVPACDTFLLEYVSYVKRGVRGVVCGGIVHPAQLPSPDVSLRWLYEKRAEKTMTAEWRNRNTYTNFRSFNFLIDRESFASVLFNEKIRHYGFEDNLFGCNLLQRGIPLLHIDNPMLNVDIEPNALFVKKSEEAMRTLALHYEALAPLVRVSGVLGKLERWRLGWLFSLFYKMLRPLVLRNLCGEHPSITLFNLYKAGYLREQLKKRGNIL